jgi:DNA-binding XRE family transcriptional regulator
MFQMNDSDIDIAVAIAENGRMFRIGDAIICVREERKLTQAELAGLAHVRPNTLGDLEHNRKNPGLRLSKGF